MHRSIWNENDSSRRRVKRCLGLNAHFNYNGWYSFQFFPVLLPFRLFLYRHIFFRMTRTVS